MKETKNAGIKIQITPAIPKDSPAIPSWRYTVPGIGYRPGTLRIFGHFFVS